MNKEFIPYEQALELKELGFDERCFGFYNPRHEISKEPLYEHTGGTFDNYNRTDYLVSAPLYQQAFRWFREKYLVDAEIYLQHELGHKFYHYLVLQLVRGNIEWKSKNKIKFITYEEAELACLKKLIEIAKNK
jgi:hypothetical protein